jgi:hypothetical protein
MNHQPFIFRDAPAPCPPSADWMMGGSCDPAAADAYGFTEAQVATAALAAYHDALAHSPGADRETLRDHLVSFFVDELDTPGA